MVCRLEHTVPDLILAVHLINQIGRIAADLEVDDIGIDLTGTLIGKRLIYGLDLLFMRGAVIRSKETAADDRHVGHIELILFAERADPVDHGRGADGKCEHDDKIVQLCLQLRELSDRISGKIMAAHKFIACKDTGSLNSVGTHGRENPDGAVTHSVEIDRACFGFQAIPDGYFFCNKLKHFSQFPS